MDNEKFLNKFIGRTELMGKGGVIDLMNSAHININKNSNRVIHLKKNQLSNLEKGTTKSTEIRKLNNQNYNFPDNKKSKIVFNSQLMKNLNKKIGKPNDISNINNTNNDLFVQKSSSRVNTNQVFTLNNYLGKRNVHLPNKNLKTFLLKSTGHNQENHIPIPKLKNFYYLPSLNTPSNNRQCLGISPTSKSPLPFLNYNQKYVDSVNENNNIIVNYNKSENNKIHSKKKISKSSNQINNKQFEINRVKGYFEKEQNYFSNINLKKEVKNINANINKKQNDNLYEDKKPFKKVASYLNPKQSFDNLLNMIKEEDDEDNKNTVLIKKSRNYRENNNIGYFSLNEENEIDKLVNQRKMYQKLLPKNSIFKINEDFL